MMWDDRIVVKLLVDSCNHLPKQEIEKNELFQLF